MSKFTDAVRANTPTGYSLCLDSVCKEHGERRCEDYSCRHADEDSVELGFSWRGCDSCGSHLGGDRYTLAYVSPYKDGFGCDILELSSCQDCLFYCANGDEPEEWSGE